MADVAIMSSVTTLALARFGGDWRSPLQNDVHSTK